MKNTILILSMLMLTIDNDLLEGQSQDNIFNARHIPTKELPTIGQFSIVAYYSNYTKTDSLLMDLSLIEHAFSMVYLVNVSIYDTSLSANDSILVPEGIIVPQIVLYGPSGNAMGANPCTRSDLNMVANQIQESLDYLEAVLGSEDSIIYFARCREIPPKIKKKDYYEVDGSRVFKISELVDENKTSVVVSGADRSFQTHRLLNAIIACHFDTTQVDLYFVNLPAIDDDSSALSLMLWQLDRRLPGWPLTCYLIMPGGMEYVFPCDSISKTIEGIKSLIEVAYGKGFSSVSCEDDQNLKSDRKNPKAGGRNNIKDPQSSRKEERMKKKTSFTFRIDSLFFKADNTINLNFKLELTSDDEETNSQVYTLCLQVRSEDDTVYSTNYSFKLMEVKNRTLISRDLFLRDFKNKQHYIFYVALKKNEETIMEKEFHYLYRIPVMGEPCFQSW